MMYPDLFVGVHLESHGCLCFLCTWNLLVHLEHWQVSQKTNENDNDDDDDDDNNSGMMTTTMILMMMMMMMMRMMMMVMMMVTV